MLRKAVLVDIQLAGAAAICGTAAQLASAAFYLVLPNGEERAEGTDGEIAELNLGVN